MIGERLHLDFETRSLAKFGKGGVGLYRYAQCPTTSVWCAAYRFGLEGPVDIWWRDEAFPTRVYDHIASGGTIVAHNGPFERRMWNVVLNRQLGGWLPQIEIAQIDCTMARAKSVGLPPDLARCAKVVNAPFQKDEDGHHNMMVMAKPRRAVWLDPAFYGNYVDGSLKLVMLEDGLERSTYGALGQCFPVDRVVLTIEWAYSTGHRQIHTDYCKGDVLAETGVDMVVPAWSSMPSRERRLWELNEKINDRGIPIDTWLVNKVSGVLDVEGRRANSKIWTVTGGRVKKCSEHAKLRDWLDTRGVRATVLRDGEEKLSVAKGVKDELLVSARNDKAAEIAIELHASTAKLAYAGKIGKTLEVMNDDHRIRGVFSYHTAPTGRFSALVWQAHNLERVDVDVELPTVRQLIKIFDLLGGEAAADCITLVTGRPLHWMSKMSRPVIKARKGKVLRGVDLSNIEGRVAAWTAGETWKLDAFAAFDRKEGPDLYRVTAGNILAKAPDTVTRAERQTLGKVPDLAGTYQGSIGAYVSMGLQLGTKPEDIADIAAATTDPAVWAATAKTYRTRFSCGLEQSVWTGIKIVVNAWRARHPAIVDSWWERQDAAIEAVSVPGMVTQACGGKIRYLASDGFLWCWLPSGRAIAYPSPSIVWTPYIKEERQIVDGVEVVIEVEAHKRAVQVWGLEKNQWVSYTLFGGLQCENDTQGIARDICFDEEGGALALDALGYYLIFHCHDELLSEDDPSFGSPQEMATVLSRPRSYAPGLPLAAAAWEDERYVK